MATLYIEYSSLNNGEKETGISGCTEKCPHQSFFFTKVQETTPSVPSYRHWQPVIFVMHFTQYKKIHHIYKEWDGNHILFEEEICYWKTKPAQPRQG